MSRPPFQPPPPPGFLGGPPMFMPMGLMPMGLMHGGPRGPPGMFPGQMMMPPRPVVPRPPSSSGLGIISQLRASAVKSSGPSITSSAEKSTVVYVGKIAPTLDDDVVSGLLGACGKVKSWKRASDPETKELKGFGFCEFDDADGVLRAIRLLNGLKIDGQELLLKGNTATQKYIEEYEQQKAKEKEKEKAERLQKAKARQEEGEVVDEEAVAATDNDQDEDNKVLESVMSIVSEQEEKYQKMKGSSVSERQLPPPPVINSTTLPSSGQSRDRDRDKDRDRDRDDGGSSRDRDRQREIDKERRDEEDRQREQDRMYEARLREWERIERDTARARDRERERDAAMESDRWRSVKADLEVADPEDDLQPWMRRPISSSRRSMERRKRRYFEEQEDEADRLLELREGGRKSKKIPKVEEEEGREGTPGPSEGGSAKTSIPGPKGEPREVDTTDPIYLAMMEAAKQAPSIQQEAAAKQAQYFSGRSANGGAIKSEHKREIRSQSPPPASSATAGSGLGRGLGKIGKPASLSKVAAVFGDDEEEGQKTRKLMPIQYTEEELRSVHEPDPEVQAQAQADVEAQAKAQAPAAAMSNEERQNLLKRLMDTIPTSKEGVWAFTIRWDAYDKTVMGLKFSNWVAQKVEQLLGMPEPSLVDYVMDLLSQRSDPERTFTELHPVLDADTETFVIKLYRMVIYETEKTAAKL